MIEYEEWGVQDNYMMDGGTEIMEPYNASDGNVDDTNTRG